MAFESLNKRVIKLLVNFVEKLPERERIPFSEIKDLIPFPLRGFVYAYLERRFGSDKIVRIGNQWVLNTFFPPFPSRAFDNVIGRGLDYPMSTNIVITDQCHGKCDYCNNPTSGQRNLTKEGLVGIISQLQDLKVPIIGFTGGEPLLRDDLDDIIASVDERSSTILYTSGNGLTEERAKRLKEAGLFVLSISLDHYDQETNDLGRFPGSFELAVKAIHIAVNTGFYTVTNIVVTDRSVKELESYLQFVNGLGVHGVRVQERIPSGRCLQYPPLSVESTQRLIELHQKINADPNLPQLTTVTHTESAEMYGCGAGGVHHMYVDGQGNLRACDFIPISFGDLTKEPLSSAYARMREFFKSPEDGCFMKGYASIVAKLLNGRTLVSYDEIAPEIQNLRTGNLPQLYQ